MPDDNKPTRQELHAEYQELYNLVPGIQRVIPVL